MRSINAENLTILLSEPKCGLAKADPTVMSLDTCILYSEKAILSRTRLKLATGIILNKLTANYIITS